MSKNRNRAKFNKAQNGRIYKIMVINDAYPLYWDEGKVTYNGLYKYEYRMYRTWKYNRKTQWK